MTYRGFLSRSTIGLRSPRSVSHNITPENGGTAGHYAGPAQNVNSHDDCLRLWRGYQRYHMDTHGWTDIAYTLGVCDHGYILAGRGAGVRTAANGTNSGNQNYYAVCWIGGKGETPTQDAKDAFWAAVKMLREQGKAGSRVVRHSDFKATSCPGNLGTVIDSGPKGGTMPEKRYDTGTGTLGVGDSGTYVRNLQQQLNDTGFDAGTVDGDFGPATEGAVERAQQKLGLTVDGLYGPNTRTALDEYTEELLAPEPEPTPEPATDYSNGIGLVRVGSDSAVFHVVGEYLVPLTSPAQADALVKVHGGTERWQDYVVSITKEQAALFTKIPRGGLPGGGDHTHDYAPKGHGHSYAPKAHSHDFDGVTVAEILAELRTRLS